MPSFAERAQSQRDTVPLKRQLRPFRPAAATIPVSPFLRAPSSGLCLAYRSDRPRERAHRAGMVRRRTPSAAPNLHCQDHIDAVVREDEATGAGFRRDRDGYRAHSRATVAAMNPAESECTILVFVSGSPDNIGVRATVPFTTWSGFGFASCVKNVESTESFGQGCHRTKSGVTGRPGSILLEATRTPTDATAPAVPCWFPCRRREIRERAVLQRLRPVPRGPE